MALTLTLVAAALGFAAWNYRRRRYALQLSVWFNLCAVVYMAFGMTLARLLMSQYYEAELEEIGRMCLAAVLGFNVAYLIANFRAAPAPRSQFAGYLPSHNSVLVVVAAGFVCELAAVLLIGPLDFVFSDRVERFAQYRTHQALFYLANLTSVCLPIALARYLRFRQRRDLALAAVLVGHGVFFALSTISRYDLALVLLIAGYFLERSGHIRTPAVLAFLVVGFGATLVYKPVLYSFLLDSEYPSPIDFSEYTNWIRHTIVLLGSPDIDMPHGGYGLAFKSLFIISPEQDSLAEWFIKEFYAERTLLFPSLGYGFSGVWEGYSSNGLFGVALHFAAFGAFFGWLERSSTSMRQVVTVFALILTYRLFRSEAYNFVKTFAWYFLYPMLAIVAVDRFLVWASGAATVHRQRPSRRSLAA